MAFRKYVRFMDDDRDYSACTFAWKPEPGYEECWSFRLSRWHTHGERELFVEFLRKHRIVADMDEYSGEVHILPNRGEKNGRK